MINRKPAVDLIHKAAKYMLIHLKTINQALLDDGPWLVGDAYSLADITVACMLLHL
jgi:glutathione S-transferase